MKKARQQFTTPHIPIVDSNPPSLSTPHELGGASSAIFRFPHRDATYLFAMARLRSPLAAGVGALLGLFFLHGTPVAAQQGLTLDYCASFNTKETDAYFWTWQSNGWCKDKCSGYAFAIVQDSDCWCSNYAPGDTSDVGDCDKDCPGYPSEKCGSKDGEKFGYIALGKKPSGTRGGDKPTPTKDTTMKTATSDSDDESATSKNVFTTSGPGGISVITQTIVYRPTNLPSNEEKQSSNTGAIVGGVVGGIAVIAALVGGIVFLLWRRRRQRQQQEMGEVDEFGVQRHTSTMSKAGLLRGEKPPQYPPTALATNIRRNSRMMADSESGSPGSGHSDRRSSRPYIFDQRLNPSAIMMQDNTSRGSFVSLDDAADYHRTLNVRNPDPEDPDPEPNRK